MDSNSIEARIMELLGMISAVAVLGEVREKLGDVRSQLAEGKKCRVVMKEEGMIKEYLEFTPEGDFARVERVEVALLPRVKIR